MDFVQVGGFIGGEGCVQVEQVQFVYFFFRCSVFVFYFLWVGKGLFQYLQVFVDVQYWYVLYSEVGYGVSQFGGL